MIASIISMIRSDVGKHIMSDEALIAQLKAARLAARVSQRELSRRTGVTQSHISLIESGAVEPGLSSVVQIARALELELVAVPRKLVPAVNGIIRTTVPRRQLTLEQSARTLRSVRSGLRRVDLLAARYGASSGLDRIAGSLRELQSLSLGPDEANELVALIKALGPMENGPPDASELNRLAEGLVHLQRRAGRVASEAPRPAYAEGDEEEDDA